MEFEVIETSDEFVNNPVDETPVEQLDRKDIFQLLQKKFGILSEFSPEKMDQLVEYSLPNVNQVIYYDNMEIETVEFWVKLVKQYYEQQYCIFMNICNHNNSLLNQYRIRRGFINRFKIEQIQEVLPDDVIRNIYTYLPRDCIYDKMEAGYFGLEILLDAFTCKQLNRIIDKLLSIYINLKRYMFQSYGLRSYNAGRYNYNYHYTNLSPTHPDLSQLLKRMDMAYYSKGSSRTKSEVIAKIISLYNMYRKGTHIPVMSDRMHKATIITFRTILYAYDVIVRPKLSKPKRVRKSVAKKKNAPVAPADDAIQS